MTRRKKILIGVGVGFGLLIVLAALFGSDEDDPPTQAAVTNPVPTAVEVKPTPEPTAVEVKPIPEPTTAEVKPTPEPTAVEAKPTPEPTTTPMPPPSVTAVMLYQERKDNATRFDLTYKGKWVSITGMVGQVEDGDVRLVVDEEAYRLLGGIFIEYIALQDLPVEVQASVDKGQQFTATCKVGNYILGTMILEDCSIP